MASASDFHLSGLAIGYASERDIRAALASIDGTIEWETMGFTFLRSLKALVIVRTGAMGGDAYDVHGGWKYLGPRAVESEWAEINLAARPFTRVRNADG